MWMKWNLMHLLHTGKWTNKEQHVLQNEIKTAIIATVTIVLCPQSQGQTLHEKLCAAVPGERIVLHCVFS